VLAGWAAALDLAEQEPKPNLSGVLIFTGSVGDVRVEIWGVVDREAWETVCTTPRVNPEQPEGER